MPTCQSRHYCAVDSVDSADHTAHGEPDISRLRHRGHLHPNCRVTISQGGPSSRLAWVFSAATRPTAPTCHAFLGLRYRVSGRLGTKHSPKSRGMGTTYESSSEPGVITRSTWNQPSGYSSTSITWDADPASTSGHPLHAKSSMEGRSPRSTTTALSARLQ